MVVCSLDGLGLVVGSLRGRTMLECRYREWKHCGKRLENASPKGRYACILCSVPCSALPNPARILRCFFFRYPLTPEVSCGMQRRAGATMEGLRLTAGLSKHVQYSTGQPLPGEWYGNGRGGSSKPRQIIENGCLEAWGILRMLEQQTSRMEYLQREVGWEALV